MTLLSARVAAFPAGPSHEGAIFNVAEEPPRPLAYNSYLVEQIDPEDLKWKLLPFSSARTLWDLITLLLVIYTAIVLPFVLLVLPSDEDVPIAMDILDFVMDMFFLFDIALNFNTCFVDSSIELQYERRIIARNYLRTWFFPDLAASLPISSIMQLAARDGTGADHTASLSVIKVLKAQKLLRLGRVFKLLARFEGAGDAMRIVLLLCIQLLVVHWLACGWYAIVTMGSPSDAWLAHTTRAYDANSELASEYLTAYLAILLMLQGDGVDPRTDGQTAYTILVTVLGACINATLFATVARLTQQMSERRYAHARKVDTVNLVLRKLRIESRIANRVSSFTDYWWTKHTDNIGGEIVASLPVPLRKSVTSSQFQQALERFPLFSAADADLIGSLATQLQLEVHLPSDMILVAHSMRHCLFLVQHGRVQLISGEDEEKEKVPHQHHQHRQPTSAEVSATPRFAVITPLHRGYFHELSLFEDDTSQLTMARALTHVDLMVLHRHDFEESLCRHPHPATTMATRAAECLEAHHARLVRERILGLVLPQHRAPPAIGSAQACLSSANASPVPAIAPAKAETPYSADCAAAAVPCVVSGRRPSDMDTKPAVAVPTAEGSTDSHRLVKLEESVRDLSYRFDQLFKLLQGGAAVSSGTSIRSATTRLEPLLRRPVPRDLGAEVGAVAEAQPRSAHGAQHALYVPRSQIGRLGGRRTP